MVSKTGPVVGGKYEMNKHTFGIKSAYSMKGTGVFTRAERSLEPEYRQRQCPLFEFIRPIPTLLLFRLHWRTLGLGFVSQHIMAAPEIH